MFCHSCKYYLVITEAENKRDKPILNNDKMKQRNYYGNQKYSIPQTNAGKFVKHYKTIWHNNFVV